MTELLYRNGVNLYDAFPGYGDIIMVVDDQFIQVIPTTPRPIDACLLLEEQFEVESEFDSLEEPSPSIDANSAKNQNHRVMKK